MFRVAPRKSELFPRNIRLDVWCRALDGKSVKEIKLNPLIKITKSISSRFGIMDIYP